MTTIESIEQKAKAYDEALEQAKKELNTCGSIDCDAARQIFRFFTELKESENERIRKELLSFVRGMLACHDKPNAERNEKYESWVTWLEKQGEKIDAIENFDTEFEKQVSHLIASAINKEHEYNEGFVKWSANALLNYAKHELKKQGEQKPAWSEEYEDLLNNIEESLLAYKIIIMDNDTELANYIEKEINFLKSLKERHTWKPSEE